MQWVYSGLLFLALTVRLHAVDEPCQVIFVNRGSKDLRVNWVGSQGQTQFIAEVRPHSKHSEESFCGHHFLLVMGDLAPVVMTIKSSGKAFVEEVDGRIVVEKLGALLDMKERLSGPEWEALREEMRGKCRTIFEGHPDDLSFYCDRKCLLSMPPSFFEGGAGPTCMEALGTFDNRLYVEARHQYTEEAWQQRIIKEDAQRLGRIHKQPQEFQNFTDVGFAVRMLPSGLLAELQGFYKEFRLSKARPENHPTFDPNLSGRESDTWVLDLSQDLTNKLRDHLRPTLSEWSGVPEEELKHTALYGMRFYHNGSRLHMHVDRRDTHVLSAIVEVEHLGLAEHDQWPLQILDHSGRKHFVPSNPGQVILYESATCAHGRPDAFHGREFANLFVHFAPLGWPEKYRAPTSSVLGASSRKEPGKRDEL